MYRIAVCDDEPAFSQELSGSIRSILETHAIPHAVDLYPSAEALHSALHSGAVYHILFLDILMEGLNGMELAERIRDVDKEVSIVFVSATTRYLRQGYKVRALRYLSKPLDPAELEELLLEDFREQPVPQFLPVRQGGILRRVPLDRVVCLEAQGRKVLFHLLDEVISSYPEHKFSQLDESLPEGIIRCHRSFFVNIQNVKELKHGDAVAVNGMLIPISRAFLRQVQEAFFHKLDTRPPRRPEAPPDDNPPL